MTTAMWLRNLGACGLQAGVLVACRRASGSHLSYRAAALGAGVLASDPARVSVVAGGATLAGGSPARAARSSRRPQLSPRRSSPCRLTVRRVSSSWSLFDRLATIALCGGLFARGLWLMLGAWVLGRIRREADILDPVPEPFTRAQNRVGVAAGLYVSPRVSGPITFGLRHPIVVFPPGITNLNPSIQHAIACHELLHVRRRDWISQLVEEGIRTVFWFHPAVWWLVGRIQLTREQLVDQESVALLGSRERYVDALLAVATGQSSGYLTPAPAFFRRSLLKKRVAQILQERAMTTRRLLISLGLSAAALTLAAVVTVRSFPLEAHGQPPGTGTQPVQIVKGGEHLLHGEVPEYPGRAIEQKVEGDVLLDIAVDDRGEVSDARVLRGPTSCAKPHLGRCLAGTTRRQRCDRRRHRRPSDSRLPRRIRRYTGSRTPRRWKTKEPNYPIRSSSNERWVNFTRR